MAILKLALSPVQLLRYTHLEVVLALMLSAYKWHYIAAKTVRKAA
jgi:hypothetical protein